MRNWGGMKREREPGTCRRPQEVKTILSSFGTESWKSASAQNMSQTIALDWGGSQEVKTILSSFGTGILEV